MRAEKTTFNYTLIPFVLFFMLAVLVLTGCNNQEKEQTQESPSAEHVQPPIAGLDPDYTEFSLNGQQKDTFELKSGTRIVVPKQAFVDSGGNSVKGDVQFRYREFHNALDIFLAGVPMHLGPAGDKRQLQTAGMFEMRAEKDGQALRLARDKHIEVRFGSRVGGRNYNLFSFDDSTGNWQFRGYSSSRVNPQYQQTKEKVEELEQTRQFPLSRDYFIFDYTAALDVYYNLTNEDEYPYESNPAVRERIKGYGAQWIEIENKTRITYDGMPTVASFFLWKRLSGGTFPEWVRKGHYRNKTTRQIEGDRYHFEIEGRQGQTYQARIKCVMPLRSLLAYKPEYWENHYQQAMKKVRRERKRLRTQAKVYRRFEVNEMGFSNFDCLLKLKDPVKVKVHFSVDSSYHSNMYQLNRVFCLPGNNRSVVRIQVRDTNEIMLDAADDQFRLITVLPNKRIGRFPLSKYRGLNFDSLKQADEPLLDLKLKAKGPAIENRQQLKNTLGF